MGTLFIASTKARVTDLEAVKKVLAGYHYRMRILVQEREKTGKAVLWLTAVEKDEEWPRAVFHDDLKDLLDPADPDGTDKRIGRALLVDGDAGFIKLLLNLAPLLKTPLTIQAMSYTVEWRDPEPPFHACEWHVEPGATEIEVNGFERSGDIEDSHAAYFLEDLEEPPEDDLEDPPGE